MRISDWSSDVCSSDLLAVARPWRFESSSGHHLFFSEHLKKCIKSAEIQGNWPLDRAGSSRLFSGVPHIFAGLLRAFAKTTSGKGPHMTLTETRLRALKPKDKPYKVADDRGLYNEIGRANVGTQGTKAQLVSSLLSEKK